MISTCYNCDDTSTVDSVYMACSKCLSVTYCSRKCQKQHWPMHKPNCGKHPPIKLADDYINSILSSCTLLHLTFAIATKFSRISPGYSKCTIDSGLLFATGPCSYTGRIDYIIYEDLFTRSHFEKPGYEFSEIRYTYKNEYVKKNYIKCEVAENYLKKFIKYEPKINSIAINQPVYFEIYNSDLRILPADLTSMSDID